VEVNSADGVRDEWRHRKNVQLLEVLTPGDGDRIEADHLGQARVLETLPGRITEDGVGAACDHFPCTSIHQGLSTHDDRATGVDHVIDHHALLADEVSNDLDDLYLIRGGSSLRDDDEGAAKHFGQCLGSSDAGDVGTDDDHVLVF